MKKGLRLFLPILLILGLAACDPISVDPDSSTSSPDSSDTSSEPSSSTTESEPTSVTPSSDPSSSSSSSDTPPGPGPGPGPGPVDDPVELSWGSSTSFEDNLTEVHVGENRKAGNVRLVSSQNYEGTFTVRMIDVTVAEKATEAAKLIDYLVINVYDGNLDLGNGGTLPEATPRIQITKETPYSGSYKTASFNITGTPTGVDLSIFVTVDATASEKFSQMQQDIVRVEVDWGQAA